MYGAEKMGKGLSRKHATPSALNWVKNPQRRKIINGMRPARRIQRSIHQSEDVLVEYLVRKNSTAVIVAVV